MKFTSLRRSGFTLIEIMIVVGIIGVLATMAIPSLMRSRKEAQRAACINNLRAIKGVKEMWALNTGKGDADVPPDADLFGGDMKYIKDKPKCPAGGTYDIRAVSENPTCTIADHTF